MTLLKANSLSSEAAMTAALLRPAQTLAKDPAEAEALVALTASMAREAQGRGAGVAVPELFRLLRQAYHSIERSRPRRGSREPAAAAPAEGMALTTADQDG